jgi:hypothetical protein
MIVMTIQETRIQAPATAGANVQEARTDWRDPAP